ncbi:AraC family transcriptional regulator [Pararhizobium sp.]|uniref:AraC family transcriptional regulator n=1 Tax=Pararhizobium sp. TaxID=1977563 RepID=UPI0027197DFA|nr:AraC family transcriptional regulator [Pararhizobium sp.]MDO9418446.1 AraC family transcriptional regulator [Pararhizobium sp.]
MFEHVVSGKHSALPNFSIHWPQGFDPKSAELNIPRRFTFIGLPDSKARELRTILAELDFSNPALGCDVQNAQTVRLVDIDNCLLPLPLEGPGSAAFAIVRRNLPDIDRLFSCGFTDYITYPFSVREIQRRLLSALTAGTITIPATTPCIDPMVKAACRSLEAHLADPITVDGLAASLGTNRNTLNRAFNQAFGVGPITWLRQRRCDVAAQLLRDTTESVLNIALTVGYGDPNNFSTAFRRIYNAGPLEFRRKMSGAKNSDTGSKASRNAAR